MSAGVVDQHLDGVEAHGLRVDEPRQELCRVVQLEERRFVRGPRERRGVALVESEARERGRLAIQLLRLVPGEAAPIDAAVHEPGVKLLHLPVRAPGAHGPSEAIGVGRGEAGDLDGDAHHLLLVQDHAQGLLEDGLERRVEIAHRLDALAPPQVGVDRVPLDGPGPDDGHLDDEVIQPGGARLGQCLHLGA